MTKAVNDAMDRNNKKQKKIENFSDIKVNDIIETYQILETARKL